MPLTESDTENDYVKRINIALNFIDRNLDSELSLETISKASFYSPFHFHRIFKAIIGETLNTYIIRKRIEKTASILMHKKEISISELSFQYGFNSNSSFTKTFKKFYGINPSEFRKQAPDKHHKIIKIKSKNGQNRLIFEKYICNINDHLSWIEMNGKIEIKEISALSFATITHHGITGIESTFQKLIKWANSKNLFNNPENKVARIFHDSFKITEPDKVRMSVCLLTNELFSIEGEISSAKIKKSKCIVGRFKIPPTHFEQAWSSLFVWVIKNGYSPANENVFEIYHNNFLTGNTNEFIVDMHIPIE